ncbi:MAG: cyclic nucleotide-binding domain-containing protein [Gammaproteobacteria bacterium]|nr:cyclic nucleotide-binding domain-containing protein [Gammaproteobacteria bacterium]
MGDEDFERLFDLDLFQGVSDSQKIALRTATKTVHLEQGEILFEQGTSATHFYFVLDAWVSVLRLHESGARTVLHVFGANESFAEVAAMAIGDYPAAAEAATNSTVVSIPSSVYRELIEQDPGFAMKVIGSLAHRMRGLIVEFESSQHASGAKRLATFLLELARKNDNSTETLELPFSKQLLASRLHMQPESLSRAFSELRKHGVESSRDGHVTISSLNTLSKLVSL